MRGALQDSGPHGLWVTSATVGSARTWAGNPQPAAPGRPDAEGAEPWPSALLSEVERGKNVLLVGVGLQEQSDNTRQESI